MRNSRKQYFDFHMAQLCRMCMQLLYCYSQSGIELFQSDCRDCQQTSFLLSCHLFQSKGEEMQERTEASYFVAMSCRIIWELGMRWWNTERCSLKANCKGYVSCICYQLLCISPDIVQHCWQVDFQLSVRSEL